MSPMTPNKSDSGELDKILRDFAWDGRWTQDTVNDGEASQEDRNAFMEKKLATVKAALNAHIQAVGKEDHSPEKDGLWNSDSSRRKLKAILDDFYQTRHGAQIAGDQQDWAWIDNDTCDDLFNFFAPILEAERLNEATKSRDVAFNHHMDSGHDVALVLSGRVKDLSKRQRLAQYLGDKQ